MTPDYVETFCVLADCIYYTPHPLNKRKCRCTHSDKHHHMELVNCPLYRFDWNKMNKTPAEQPRRRRRVKPR